MGCKHFSFDYLNCKVEADLIYDNWEGSDEIPNGKHYLPDEIENVTIYSPQGEDITDRQTDAAMIIVEDAAWDYLNTYGASEEEVV